MGNFTTDKVDKRMAESIDFMVERVSMTVNLFLLAISVLQLSKGLPQILLTILEVLELCYNMTKSNILRFAKQLIIISSWSAEQQCNLIQL